MKQLTSVDMLTSKRFQFEDYSDTLEFYYEQGWTDGLPVVPATVDNVNKFLSYARRSPSEIIGTEPTKGKVITAEKVAINAIMAGCLPEYFPVVLSGIEAICEPQFDLHAVSVSTMGPAVLTVVNGPIINELKLNSGVGAFGSGHRANATIGRAIRLVITNVTGAVSGVLDKSTLGHPGKYTWCIAEGVSPWNPLNVDRGFFSKQNTVTVFAGLPPIQVANSGDHDPEQILASFIDAMFSIGPEQDELVIVICPELVAHIESAGWSKERVKLFLHENAQRKNSDWIKARFVRDDMPDHMSDYSGVVHKPENITVIVAGGEAGGFASIIPLWGGGLVSRSVTRRIKIPSGD